MYCTLSSAPRNHLTTFCRPSVQYACLMSHEWIYLTKTSNRAHEVTSVDSSTRNENIGVVDAFISFITWSFTFSGISEMLRWLVSLERDICLMFASPASPRSCFTVFNKQGFHKRFSNRVRLFSWQFQVQLHVMPVLVETSGKISLGRSKLAS